MDFKVEDILVTKRDNTLVVFEWDGEWKSGKKMFPVLCSLCSKDVELYPLPFRISKSDLKRGVIPCGCGKRNHTKYEYEIILKRFLDENQPHIMFSGWRGDKVTSKSKPVTYCNKHHIVCDSRSLHHILNSNVQCCTECTAELKRKVFQLEYNHLVGRLKLIVEGHGGILTDIVGEYKNVDESYFEWRCSLGHKCLSRIGDVLNNNNGCNLCATGGHRSDKPSYFYVFMCLPEDPYEKDPIIKYGITNNPHLKKRSKPLEIYGKPDLIICIYFESGVDSRLLETTLKRIYVNKRLSKSVLPMGYTEAFTYDYFSMMDFVSDVHALSGVNILEGKIIGESELKFKGDFHVLRTY